MKKVWLFLLPAGLLIAGCIGTLQRIFETEGIIRAIDRAFEKEDSLADSSASRIDSSHTDSTKALSKPDSL
jgi:hypothetical protein